MAIPLVELRAALDEAIAAMPGQMRYKGSVFTCSVSEVEQADDVDEAGILNESETEAVLNRSDLQSVGIPLIRVEQVEIKQSAVDADWTAYHVVNRKVDEISVTLGLMRA